MSMTVRALPGAEGDSTGYGFDSGGDAVPANAALTSIKLAVRCSATATGQSQPAIDQLRVIHDGQQLEEPHLHAAGIGTALEWYEDTLYAADLASAGIDAAKVRDASFGLNFASYDRFGDEQGSIAVVIDSTRITVEWST